ncbi:hypothetical protein ACFOLJ_14570 [Rugamonas sp. CCM 8940]|uniref:hypothetical protein n=1 Tax=Rugamonas sp. CCM 8940 TaxID=2765359 RepID=UPI0018F74D53|nr:hypothetical protein [Rugamonas sp. CCM 8940]MBJ7313312.1 hypothetical protein [Rugamonas sp. CCM 8940]
MFHSDSAVKNLLAQEIWETGQYFPRDWNYVNNDLWVFYTQTFIVPLLGWFENGFALHAFSDVVSATLILLATWLVTGMLEQSRAARLVSTILISSGMSVIFAEHVFGQAAYGSMYYMGCFLLYSYWRLNAAQGRAVLGWSVSTFVMALLVFWANPQRALMYYGLPLLTAALALHGLDHYRSSSSSSSAAASVHQPSRSGRHLLVLALGSITGIALHCYIRRLVHIDSGLTVIHWLPSNSIINNAMGTVRGILTLFDGLPAAEAKVISVSGAYTLLRMLAAVSMLVLLPWSVLNAIQAQQRSRMYFAVFTLVSLAGNLLLILTTSLADMSAPEASVRYLVPTLLFMMILLAGTIFDQPGIAVRTRVIGLFAIAVLGTSAPMVYIKAFDDHYRFPLRKTPYVDAHKRLGAFLEENKLHYGYATFWNAGKVTVLSQQHVKVRQVSLETGVPMPMRTLSSNRWYRPEAWQGETFLVLPDSQLQDVDLPRLFSLAGQPLRTLRFEDGWTIYVFADNLAATITSWDFEARTPRKSKMTAATPHQIGALQSVAGQPAALVAQDAERGALMFGPTSGVVPGTYLVSFDVEATGQAQTFGHVDVCINAGGYVLAQQAITQPGRQKLTLRFNTKQPLDPLEFRVIKQGGGLLKVSEVELRRDLSAD